MSKKLVYLFGEGRAEGHAKMKNLLGGKGANLAEMAWLGLPVPAGFTITTEVCTFYYQHNKAYPSTLKPQIETGIAHLEQIMNAKFDNPANPLLVSVRSGSRVSMPGMMETVLNVGLTTKTIPGLIQKTNDERFVYDAYRRLITMYSDVVMEKATRTESEEGLPRTDASRKNEGIRDQLENLLDALKKEKGCKNDTDLTSDDLKTLCEQYKIKIKETLGKPFPDDARNQLRGAISAVFESWNGKRALAYRRIEHLPDNWGTAVNVQAMVFGNLGKTSATGVAFTRDPATGEKIFYGEYLINAQGEDVVAGIRTPQPINNVAKKDEKQVTLEKLMPDIYQELENYYQILEQHFKDMQDIEFTIEQGKLWLLQTRTGKRTAKAAVKIAVDMANENLIDHKTAILRLKPEQLDQLLHPQFDRQAVKNILTKGLAASPGAAVGKVVFLAEEAEQMKKQGEKVILVRHETSPEDVAGMNAAQGILTARGGLTSHAAVVARGLDKPAVVGCEDLNIDYEKQEFTVKGAVIKKNDWISIDGSSGEIMPGQVPTIEPGLTGELNTLLKWADTSRKLKVRANADTPQDAQKALDSGAEGIGLCRTEHMFFERTRILTVREMILAEDESGRRQALKKLLPMQKDDFKSIFRVMAGKPVTIRLLDPPLHEFLPQTEKEIEEMAQEMQVTTETIRAKIKSLHEFNPMLGHRGCRLGITYPEISEMQTQAIIEAAGEVKAQGIDVHPEIMVPLVGTVGEIKQQKEVITRIANQIIKQKGVPVAYTIGTMIEIPRAALLANKIAEVADFFSFGTNDLTQMTFGFSRDDAGKFLPEYKEKGILSLDPFQVLDQEGVGQLVQLGVKRGRATRPELKIGICGEHGGDPASVEFCHQVGMDYVSCSPPRVPIARLAAAQAALKFGH